MCQGPGKPRCLRLRPSPGGGLSRFAVQEEGRLRPAGEVGGQPHLLGRGRRQARSGIWRHLPRWARRGRAFQTKGITRVKVQTIQGPRSWVLQGGKASEWRELRLGGRPPWGSLRAMLSWGLVPCQPSESKTSQARGFQGALSWQLIEWDRLYHCSFNSVQKNPEVTQPIQITWSSDSSQLLPLRNYTPFWKQCWPR